MSQAKVYILAVTVGCTEMYSTHSSLEAAQKLGEALVYRGEADSFTTIETMLDDSSLIGLAE